MQVHRECSSASCDRALNRRRVTRARCLLRRARMIAYDKRGASFALADGAELLLHDGDSEAPLWRATLGAPIVGVGVDGDRAIAVTAAGTVHTFGARAGDARGTASIATHVRRACVDAATSRVVALTDKQVVRSDG